VSRIALGPADLAEGTMRGVELPDGRLVLLARVGGAYHALDDVCNHAGCLLSAGRLEGARVVCPCHAMAFDVRSGAGVEPVLCGDQRAYRVVVEDGQALLAEPR
jgi:3-phenylpropionate/trans-cinnamate dioxygenase ferredoxin subunit